MSEEDEERRRDWAEFRFSVIGPLVCGQYTRSEQEIIRRGILSKHHRAPNGQDWQVSERTLRKWIAAHRQQGLAGLLDKRRKTRGVYRAIDNKVLKAAIELRKEENSRSIKQILHHLSLREDIDVSRVSKSTLNDYLNRAGVKKEKPYADQGAFQRWQKRNINALWQSDCSDGIWLPDPDGLKKVRQTSLISFIDDASRFCVGGEFYWTEQLPNLLDCFSKAVIARGRPTKIYSDNGSIYRSGQWKTTCAELTIERLFAEKQRPSGKGKVERHFLTIQRGFYKEAQLSGLTTLQELNEFFWAWLDECYHKEKHETLQQTPLERWQQQEHMIEHVPVEKLREALKLRAQRKVDFKTGLIQLNGERYLAGKHLAGETVQIRWTAQDNETIEIWQAGEFVQSAKRYVVPEDIDYSQRSEREPQRPAGTVLDSSKNFRTRLVTKRRGKRAEQSMDELLSASELRTILAEVKGEMLDCDECAAVDDFYLQACPIGRNFVLSVLSKCAAEKGKDKHIKVYLRRIRETQQHLR